MNASKHLSSLILDRENRDISALVGVPALMRNDGLLPVVLAPSAPAPSNINSDADADADADADGIIVLELGEVRVRIEGQPNAAILAQVLDRVLR